MLIPLLAFAVALLVAVLFSKAAHHTALSTSVIFCWPVFCLEAAH